MSDSAEQRKLALALMRMRVPAHPAPRRYFSPRTVPVNINIHMHLDSTVEAGATSLNLSSAKQMRALMEQCLAEHPEISIDPEVKDGLPHIRGSRITVLYVLDRLAIHGSTKKLVKLFPHISETQVKAAIDYARDVMEIACGEPEVNDR